MATGWKVIFLSFKVIHKSIQILGSLYILEVWIKGDKKKHNISLKFNIDCLNGRGRQEFPVEIRGKIPVPVGIEISQFTVNYSNYCN